MRRVLPAFALSILLLPAGSAAAASKPTISLTPKRVSHGESILVKGRGWASPKAIDRVMYFGIHGPNGERIHIGNATNGKKGRWTFTYKVKHFIKKGTWKLIARQDRKKDGATVKVRRTATFIVTR
jgi:hypothetical protein